MSKPTAGFREIEHRADWELEVWGENLAELLEQAARGMYRLAGAHLNPARQRQHEFKLRAPDPESLLVNFLAELLYLVESKNQAFDHFDLKLDGYALDAHLGGCELESIDKEIKAVTYHRLAVQPTSQGLVVRIVFDV